MVHFSWGDLTDNTTGTSSFGTAGLTPEIAVAPDAGAPGVLTVGVGEMFATLAQAMAVAQNGSVILVDAGTYVNDFAIVTAKVTIEGVGGMANFVATEAPPDEKGILTVDNDVTIENCSFSGCSISDVNGGNGAGIRYEGGQMVLENDSFSNNQNGILGAPSIVGLTNTVSVDHCLFDDNGSGTGLTHNFYMGNVSRVTFTNNVSVDANVGHEFKSRAYVNVIQNNVFADGATGDASYQIDLPDGGADTVTGNYIEKGPQGINQAMVHFGGEGIPYAGSSLLVSGNVFQNDYGPNAVAVLNQTAISATITSNTFVAIAASNIASGPAKESSNVDGQGNAIADQTLAGVLPGNTLVLTDGVAHSVTLDGSILAVEGGAGRLTATAVSGHVVAIGGSGGMDYSETGTSGGNTISTLAGSSNTLALIGQDTLDSEGNDSISCGPCNINGQIGGVAQVTDGTGNDQWVVTGTATITGTGGNPVISVGSTGSVSVLGTVGYLHVSDNGGSFAFDVAQGGGTEAMSGTGGAMDVQVYNATAYATTANGPQGVTIQATSGNAQILSVGSDVIHAGSGNDTVIVEGAATVYAGTGSLSVFGRSDTAGAKVYGDGGTYLISGDTGNITYYGGDQASTVQAQLSNITLIGGAGLLSVLGGSGDTMTGGAGGLNYDAVDGGGNDTISTAAGAQDTLTLAGSDTVNSYGNDLIDAGTANQTINVFGDSQVLGSTGNSQLSFAGDDTLVGAGFDRVSVDAGANLTMTAGNLAIVTETGAVVAFSTADGSASATVSGGGAEIDGGTWAGPGLTISTSSDAATSVALGTGNSTVYAYGDDTIAGGSGQGTVFLKADGSSVLGGSGSLSVHNYDWNAQDSHTVQAGAGNLTYDQGMGTLTFLGGSGNASIDGGSGALFITAGSGNLQVQGGQSGLNLIAGSGNLTLAMSTFGGSVEFGSGDANVQVAGWGNSDTFDFAAGHGGGLDVIAGFRAGTDTLSFNGVSVTSETIASGSTNLTLSDNTHIVLTGFVDTQNLF